MLGRDGSSFKGSTGRACIGKGDERVVDGKGQEGLAALGAQVGLVGLVGLQFRAEPLLLLPLFFDHFALTPLLG